MGRVSGRHSGIIGVMHTMKNKMFLIKTVLTCCIALFIAYMLINVESFSNVDIKEVENQIVTTGDLGTMKKSNNMMIKKVFGLNDAEYDGTIYYKGEGAMDVTELLIIKLKSKDQASSVESAVRKRLDSQIQNFTNYGTNQLQLLESSVIKVSGNYFFYVVSENAVQLKDIFSDSI